MSASNVAERPSGPRSIVILLVCLVACFAAAAIGSAATFPNIQSWYAGLEKPGFTPPNGVFGPVWTALYTLMAIALWRVIIRSSGTARARAVLVFAVQLVLNTLWSVVFFGLHAVGGALIVIVLLEVAILATIRQFAPIDRPAAWMLAPYVVWVGYASLLNLAILILN